MYDSGAKEELVTTGKVEQVVIVLVLIIVYIFPSLVNTSMRSNEDRREDDTPRDDEDDHDDDGGDDALDDEKFSHLLKLISAALLSLSLSLPGLLFIHYNAIIIIG